MSSVNTSLDKKELAKLVVQQLNNYFPDGNVVPESLLYEVVKKALPRLEFCFSKINNKYFFDGKCSVFDHLHGDQYAMWLYFLANELHRMRIDEHGVCKKLFLLNKALHGCDIFYEISLPDVFLLVHPLGTVLGRGDYSDYFLAYQKCGVGSNNDLYPKMGKYFTLRPGSSALGNCNIGNNVSLAADSLLLDQDIAEDTIYYGKPKQNFVRNMNNPLNIWRAE